MAVGRCCTSDGCKVFFKVGSYCPPKVTTAELSENLARVANYVEPFAGQKRPAAAALPVVHCVPLPVQPVCAPSVDAQEAVADAERCAAASEESAVLASRMERETGLSLAEPHA